jgi:hypothetical protein
MGMSSYEINLEDPPERWQELYAWLEQGAKEAAIPPASARVTSSSVPLAAPAEVIALYAAYLAGEV